MVFARCFVRNCLCNSLVIPLTYLPVANIFKWHMRCMLAYCMCVSSTWLIIPKNCAKSCQHQRLLPYYTVYRLLIAIALDLVANTTCGLRQAAN